VISTSVRSSRVIFLSATLRKLVLMPVGVAKVGDRMSAK
jgi:hypothetical protein